MSQPPSRERLLGAKQDMPKLANKYSMHSKRWLYLGHNIFSQPSVTAVAVNQDCPDKMSAVNHLKNHQQGVTILLTSTVQHKLDDEFVDGLLLGGMQSATMCCIGPDQMTASL